MCPHLNFPNYSKRLIYFWLTGGLTVTSRCVCVPFEVLQQSEEGHEVGVGQ